MSSHEMLLVDCVGDVALLLEEGKSVNSPVKFRGKFQEANRPNKNKRIYPETVLKKNVDSLMEVVKERGLVGEIDHPQDSIIHFNNASHIVTNLWWEGNTLMGEGEILKTPAGKTLQSLIEAGVRVGISSRGVGNGQPNSDGILVIGESYKLITFDVVADPSTIEAFQQRVVNDESYLPKIEKIPVKNEGSCIDKINAKALISYFGEYLEQRAKNIKERLK